MSDQTTEEGACLDLGPAKIDPFSSGTDLAPTTLMLLNASRFRHQSVCFSSEAAGGFSCWAPVASVASFTRLDNHYDYNVVITTGYFNQTFQTEVKHVGCQKNRGHSELKANSVQT